MPGFVFCELRGSFEGYQAIHAAVETARLMGRPDQYGVAVLSGVGVDNALVALRMADWRDIVARLDLQVPASAPGAPGGQAQDPGAAPSAHDSIRGRLSWYRVTTWLKVFCRRISRR